MATGQRPEVRRTDAGVPQLAGICLTCLREICYEVTRYMIVHTAAALGKKGASRIRTSLFDFVRELPLLRGLWPSHATNAGDTAGEDGVGQNQWFTIPPPERVHSRGNLPDVRSETDGGGATGTVVAQRSPGEAAPRPVDLPVTGRPGGSECGENREAEPAWVSSTQPWQGSPSSRPRMKEVLQHRALFTLDSFLTELSGRIPFARRDTGVMSQEIAGLIERAVEEEEEALSDALATGEATATAEIRQEGLVFLNNLAALLWSRNLLNQDSGNQELLAGKLMDFIYRSAAGFSPPLRRKVLSFCVNPETSERPRFLVQPDAMLPELRHALDCSGCLSSFLLSPTESGTRTTVIDQVEGKAMRIACRRMLIESASPASVAALSTIRADALTYSAMEHLLELLRAGTTGSPPLTSELMLVLETHARRIAPGEDLALYELHSYLSYQFDRWTRVLPELFIIGSPGNMTRMRTISDELGRCPGPSGLDRIKRDFAEILGTLLAGCNDSGSATFQSRVVDALDSICLFEELHGPIKHLDMAVHALRSMGGLVQSLITKEIPLDEETRLTTFLDAVGRAGRAVQLGDEPRVTSFVIDLLPGFLSCALPATSRGTGSWRRLYDELQSKAGGILSTPNGSQWDAFMDGIKWVRELERRQVDVASPAETMHFVSQKDGELCDHGIQHIVDESLIVQQYELFSRVFLPPIKETITSIKSLFVKNLDTLLESPFLRDRHDAMKDMLDVQHPLATAEIFFYSLGNVVADRWIRGGEASNGAATFEFLPLIGEWRGAKEPPTLQGHAFTDNLLAFLTRLYPLSPQEVSQTVGELVRTLDAHDMKAFPTEEKRQTLTVWLHRLIEKAQRENERVFSPRFLESVSFLRRIPPEVNPDIHAFFCSVLFPHTLRAAVRHMIRDSLEERRQNEPAVTEGDRERTVAKILDFYRLRAEQTVEECALLYDSTVSLVRQATLPAAKATAATSAPSPAAAPEGAFSPDLLDQLSTPDRLENPFSNL